jgi:hypothetical protein
MNKIPYQYQTIGYLHDVFTGEFLVIGVVVYSSNESRYVLRFASNFERIVQAFPSATTSGIKRIAQEFRSLLDDKVRQGIPITAQVMADLLPTGDGGIRLSSLGSGLAKSLDDAANTLAERIVDLHCKDSRWLNESPLVRMGHSSPSTHSFAGNDAQWEDSTPLAIAS